MTDNKVALEVAELDFDKFVEEMDLDLDPATMSQEEADTFAGQKRTIIRAIQNGSLTFGDDSLPSFTPRRSEGIATIKFQRPKGDAWLAMDKSKKGEDISKLFGCMATHWSVPHKSAFSKMDGADVKVCQTITLLFLV